MPAAPVAIATDEREGERSTLFDGLASRLMEDATDRVARRWPVERRWIDDLRQYEGEDDPDILAKLKAVGRSTATLNVTRPKANTFESRVFDMLFPTDDRNWGIRPTPVPELDREARQVAAAVEGLTAEANAEESDERAEAMRAEADGLAQALAELEGERHEARQRADLMQAEIEDNLVECEYPVECRDVIHDAVTAGTGFLKGPIPLAERIRTRWQRSDKGAWKLHDVAEAEGRFAFQHVSYWHLFPDTAARRFDQVESWFERHLMRARDLRAFARQPGVDKDAVRRVLRDGPQEEVPDYLLELSAQAEGEDQLAFGDEKFFVVWEYRGPLPEQEMEEILRGLAREANPEGSRSGDSSVTVGGTTYTAAGSEPEIEIDPLVQMDAVVFLCQGEVLKVGVNANEDNGSVYQWFQIEKSTSRLWTYGLPRLMRSQQAIANDGWRMMLDNAAWSIPVIEVDERVLQPNGDGKFVIAPGQVLRRNSQAGEHPGLIVHTVPINQEQFAAIVQLALQFLDTETNLSILAQGEQGTTTRTAGGMALLMNAVNVVIRRIVRMFDDQLTVPAITKAYHFLMTYSPREDIKGDYCVEARGSSVLLVKEVQGQNLLVLAQQMSLHPTLGQMFNVRNLLKKLLQSMLISSEDVLKTEEELEAELAAQAEAEANAPPPPEMVKLQLEREVAQLRFEVEMAKIAADGELSLEEIAAKLEGIREQTASRERIFAAESAIDGRKPAGASTAGGYV